MGQYPLALIRRRKGNGHMKVRVLPVLLLSDGIFACAVTFITAFICRKLTVTVWADKSYVPIGPIICVTIDMIYNQGDRFPMPVFARMTTKHTVVAMFVNQISSECFCARITAWGVITSGLPYTIF